MYVSPRLGKRAGIAYTSPRMTHVLELSLLLLVLPR
jgi:hypothetical protein